MHDRASADAISTLAAMLAGLGEVGVAVSGGVDSMTLAIIAGRTPQCRVTMFHAVSHAVPREATERVNEYGKREHWNLKTIDAGEFGNDAYVQNPVNRCFHCKAQLYSTIRSAFSGVILSGTNVDDLGDFRPGLDAAKTFDVKHPYVEAGISKDGIRRIAAFLGMAEIAKLPASPCLSSRVETGIPVSRERLKVIEDCELLLRGVLGASTIRCRIRSDGIGIELDETILSGLTAATKAELRHAIERIARAYGVAVPDVIYGPYRRGSAFLVGSPTKIQIQRV